MKSRVDEAIRRRNSLAVVKRDAWRSRYKLVVENIKSAKLELRRDPCNALKQVQLESCRAMAQIMMMEREMLGWELRDSAYEWV